MGGYLERGYGEHDHGFHHCSLIRLSVSIVSPSQVDHLVSLGVNTVELLPVHEYDEMEFQRFPNPRDHMVGFLTHGGHLSWQRSGHGGACNMVEHVM